MDSLIVIALLMGLGGSLHCVSMCGPLIFSVQFSQGKTSSVFGMLTYHFGRMIAYILLGLLFSLFIIPGELFRIQQYLSVIAGVLVIMVVFKDRIPPVSRLFAAISNRLTSAIQTSNSFKAGMPVLGFLNGLLPCGLSYAAAALSLSYGSVENISLFMLAFGFGTAVSFMLLAMIGPKLLKSMRINVNRYMRVALVITAFLMVLRGSGLGIPYISPAMDSQEAEVECCHKPGP